VTTEYPGGIDNFPNPLPSDKTNSTSVPHANQHQNINDAVEALEIELGTNPKSGHASVRARLDNIQQQVTALSGVGGIAPDWPLYTPALTAAVTNPTLGTGSTAAGRFFKDRRHIVGKVKLIFGSSGVTAGSGDYFVSLPTTAKEAYDVVGFGLIFDSSTGTFYQVVARADATSQKCNLYIHNSATAVTHASPVAWNTSDVIRLSLDYESFQ
jgi:hypothetical protein